MSNEKACDWCDGSGFIIEDKDAYFYYAPEQIRNINRQKDKDEQRKMVEELRKLRGMPMQPYATPCPKCDGTGRKTNDKTG